MNKVCAYCGGPADTMDHVPPKCLFRPPLPNNMITVPACRNCNASFQSHEEHVRNVLTSLADREGHDSIVSHLAGKRNRSLHRSRPALEDVLAILREVEVRAPSGIALGSAVAMDLDNERFDEFFDRTVRGLIHHTLGTAAPSDLETEWRVVEEGTRIPIPSQQGDVQVFHGQIGTEFEYIGIAVRPDWPSLWVLQFYGGRPFMVLCKPFQDGTQDTGSRH
jgi:hypothetical protein